MACSEGVGTVLTGERGTFRQLDGQESDAVWETVNDVEGNDFTATAETFTREHIDDMCGSHPEQAGQGGSVEASKRSRLV
jgi:hypothetical protein